MQASVKTKAWQQAQYRGTRPPSARRRRGIGRREWIYVLSQIGLVAAVELGDDTLHALAPKANAAIGLTNALRGASFERSHDLWVEPGIQGFFAGTHHLLGQTIGWNQVEPLFDAMYGQGHVFFTFAFALWIYFFRRPLFSFIRNVFLVTTVLAVTLYETFPLAPPRLATGLQWDGHPYHFLDAVFGAGGLQLSFNEYAAMPSLHVAWALIVGLGLAWAARPLPIRLLGLIYPVIMLITVVVTGNHYVLDAIGALVVVFVAIELSVLIAWRCTRFGSLRQTMIWLNAMRNRVVGVQSPSARARRSGASRLQG
jgi:membrane-associated phospholipid phosphatase